MEVKDVRISPSSSERSPASSSSEKPITADKLQQTQSAALDVIQLQSDQIDTSPQSSQARNKLNAVISVVNVAEEATSEVKNLVRSLSGILDQAASNELPENRRTILENEANQLVSAIKESLHKASPNGVKPLAGDPVQLDIEEKFGKTLEILLPDNSADNLGLAAVTFSQKDAIIQTRATIASAEIRLKELEEAVSKTKERIHLASTTLDVALQNNEAASASLRDVDQALKLATDTHLTIGSQPDLALNSVGALDTNALELLKN